MLHISRIFFTGDHLRREKYTLLWLFFCSVVCWLWLMKWRKVFTTKYISLTWEASSFSLNNDINTLNLLRICLRDLRYSRTGWLWEQTGTIAATGRGKKGSFVTMVDGQALGEAASCKMGGSWPGPSSLVSSLGKGACYPTQTVIYRLVPLWCWHLFHNASRGD